MRMTSRTRTRSGTPRWYSTRGARRSPPRSPPRLPGFALGRRYRPARCPSPRAGIVPRVEPILVFGPWSERYDLGPGHPLTPRRFGPGIDLIRAVTAAAGGGPIRELPPEPAPDTELRWVHDAGYIEVVRRFSDQPFGSWEAGIGPGDTPAFPGMHDASAAVAGGSIRAMAAILRGDTDHAVHPGGGLHHAMPGRASGFCVYDDPALAIAKARLAGLRVLYVDLDVHHGDGVQAIHLDDPGVLTLSIHQSGRTLFPGTGFVGELGAGTAAGTVFNLPMEPGTGERGWLGALRTVLPEVAATFGPDVVVSQHGADAHAWDPLANLRVTTTAMGAAARLVHAIAHRWAGGRWLATGGGGYDAYRVVPRAWAHAWLAAAHLEPPSRLPAAWRERWAGEAERYGQAPLPEWLDDEANAGLRPDGSQDAADRRAIETAALVRELAVPALVRAAGDLGWWRASVELDAGGWSGLGAPVGDGSRVATGTGDTAPGIAAPGITAPDGVIEVLDTVDAATWVGLDLASQVIAPASPAGAQQLVLAALTSPHAVRVSAAVAGGTVVGLVVSAAPGGRRLLLGLGVAPDRRRRGLAGELLRRHVDGPHGVEPWDAAVTLAERDAVEPLARDTRGAIARRLLEGAGFEVGRAGGPVGDADPGALVAHRG
ncbi:MAG: acetoin utilization protein AcuC [Chloroflexota bacterium]|nr:MAG: acetoin utilization protein AcuC [Chloroflexota bacterium]